MYNYTNFQKNQKAIALGYDEKVDKAPKIIAAGNGVIAAQMLDIAASNNIPVHKNAYLVQILSILEINSYIPIEAYNIVAKILSYIYEQDKLNKINKLKK